METDLARQPSRWWTHAVFLLPLIAFLHPAIFAYDDDFLLLRMVRWEEFPWLHNLIVAEGRPLYAFAVRFAFAVLTTLDDLIWLRLFGLAGVIATAVVAARFAERHLAVAADSARLGAVMLVLTPAMGVYTFWGATSFYAWGAALAVGGGGLAWCGWRETDRRRRWKLVLGGAALGFATELLYQPSAGFFILPALIATVIPRGTGREVRASAWTLATFVAVLGAYFVAYKLSATLFFADFPNAGRGGHLSIDNFTRYFASNLPMAASGWALFRGPQAKWAFQALLLVGGIVWVIASLRRAGSAATAQRVALWGAALFLTGAPLLGSGTYSPFRTLAAPTAILLLPALAGWWRLMSSAKIIRWRAGIAIGATLVLAAFARHVVEAAAIQPVRAEYLALREGIEEQFDAIPRSITIVAATSRQVRGLSLFLEYGSPSSRSDWQTRNMVQLMLAEHLGMAAGEPRWTYLSELTPIIVLRVSPDSKLAAWGPVINLPAEMGVAPPPSVRVDAEAPPIEVALAPFGTVRRWPSGWCEAEGFGRFLPAPDAGDWILHADLGWIRMISCDPDTYYVYSRLFGKVTGYRSWWPWVQLHDFDRKLELERFTAARNDPGGDAWELLTEIARKREGQQRRGAKDPISGED